MAGQYRSCMFSNWPIGLMAGSWLPMITLQSTKPLKHGNTDRPSRQFSILSDPMGFTIPSRCRCVNNIETETEKLLEKIYHMYNYIPTYDLSHLTHIKGWPWHIASKQRNRSSRLPTILLPVITKTRSSELKIPEILFHDPEINKIQLECLEIHRAIGDSNVVHSSIVLARRPHAKFECRSRRILTTYSESIFTIWFVNEINWPRKTVFSIFLEKIYVTKLLSWIHCLQCRITVIVSAIVVVGLYSTLLRFVSNHLEQDRFAALQY